MRALGSFDPTLYRFAIRLAARSILFALAILSLPWLRAAVPDRAADDLAPAQDVGDDAAHLLMLLGDLRRNGLLAHGDRAVLVGGAGYAPPVLERSRIDPVSEQLKLAVADRTVDFVLMADVASDPDFSFTDRVLKVGGIVAATLDSGKFRVPANYRIVYVRRFRSTVVAVKKIAPAATNAEGAEAPTARRLLAAPKPKNAASSTRLRSPLALKSTHKHQKHYFDDYWINVSLNVNLARNGRSTWLLINKYLMLNWKFGMEKLSVMLKRSTVIYRMSLRLPSNIDREYSYGKLRYEVFVSINR